MYTIKQASARTGVGAPLIRAWERRYGVVSPARTASGYRLYDETAIGVLQTMRRLVDSGWTASEAARAINAGEVSIDRAGSPVPPGSSAAPTTTGSRTDTAAGRRAALVTRFVAAAASTSPAATEAALDEILAAGSFEAVVDDLLLPAVAALGDAWAAGSLTVAAEHAASAAVTRRLAAVYQAAGTPARPSAVVGLPPGSRHEIGALAFAAALRRRGIGVLYLGQDVPVDGWLDALDRARARAAVVVVVTPDDRDGATAVAEAVLARGTAIVAIGGAAAGAGLDPDGRVLMLPDRVVDGARVLAEAIGRRPIGRRR